MQFKLTAHHDRYSQLPTALVTQDSAPSTTSAPRGVYIWGGVGCGKTMLMDLFMHHVHGVNKTRVHFNSFMQSVHQQIHQYRTQQQVVKDDPLDYVVQQIRAQTQLLCFDEFQVTNIADAMLLGRLFDKLWQRHVIVVATSNRPPDGEYLLLTRVTLRAVLTCHVPQICTREGCSAHCSCPSSPSSNNAVTCTTCCRQWTTDWSDSA